MIRFILCSALLLCGFANAAEKKPNVLLLVSDDLAATLGQKHLRVRVLKEWVLGFIVKIHALADDRRHPITISFIDLPLKFNKLATICYRLTQSYFDGLSATSNRGLSKLRHMSDCKSACNLCYSLPPDCRDEWEIPL